MGKMNLILFDHPQPSYRLAHDDPRARHIRDVLHMGVGDELFVGLINGPRGKAAILADNAQGLWLEVDWEKDTEPMLDVCVIAGLPRPQTARDLLREAATFGVKELWFFKSEKGESSYAQSSLWTTDEWQKRLRHGAEQACCTGLPQLRHFENLSEALKELDERRHKIALDVYEATAPLSTLVKDAPALTLALGSERGWSPAERDTLREHAFALAHLSHRVLRAETAMAAGLSVWLGVRGVF